MMAKQELTGTDSINGIYARFYANYANKTNFSINVKKVDTG